MRVTSPLNERDEFQLLKPKFKWIANMHGDETIGREMMIALIYYLLLNSKSDSRISRLLSTTDIYIMPSMNPVNRKNCLNLIFSQIFRMGLKKLSKVYVRLLI
jgi:hypothetical protein